jgi:hypothetical protein
MGIRWQTRKMQDKETMRFSFPGKISGYFAALSGFQFGYGNNTSYEVTQVKILLNAQKDGESVLVTATMVITDGKKEAFQKHTWAHVTVVALIAEDRVLGYLNESSGSPLNEKVTTGKEIYSAAAVLSEFSLSYEEHKHWIWEISAEVNAQANDREVSLTGNAEMYDKSNNHAVCKNIGAGYIARYTKFPGFGWESKSVNQGNNWHGHDNPTFEVVFPREQEGTPEDPDRGMIKGAVALLASFNLKYASDQKVSCIKAGAMEYHDGKYYNASQCTVINGNSVTVTYNLAMFDKSHDSNQNSAKFLVLATYDEDGNIPPDDMGHA